MPAVTEKNSLEIEIENINNTKFLTAAAALRRDIISQQNLILLTEPGKVDRVIRVVPLKSRKLDLGNGPQSEEWHEIERQIYTMSRRDRPIPTPVPVSPSTKDEWSLRPDDVPVVFLVGQDNEAKQTTEGSIADYAKYSAPAKPENEAVNDGITHSEPIAAPVKRVGRPVDKTPLVCDLCGNTYKGHNGLQIHKTTRHKPSKSV